MPHPGTLQPAAGDLPELNQAGEFRAFADRDQPTAVRREGNIKDWSAMTAERVQRRPGVHLPDNGRVVESRRRHLLSIGAEFY